MEGKKKNHCASPRLERVLGHIYGAEEPQSLFTKFHV